MFNTTYGDKTLFTESIQVDSNIIWNESLLDNAIASYTSTLMGYLYLAALIYLIYAGFKILTAWEDDEKISNWKKTIVTVLLAIALIFAANSIVLFIIEDIIN